MAPARARPWLLVVAWCAVIFALSSVPSLGTGLGTWDLVLRKVAHAAEYAVLAVLVVRALDRAGPRALSPRLLPAAALALGVGYAATDELHQSFVRGRAGRPLDVAIDAVGLVAGLLLWQRVTSRRLVRA
jgi:VanZ family protein